MAASFQGFRLQREPLISFALGAFVFVVAVSAAKTPQVEPNHMRWSNHDAVLNNAVAWQEEQDGHWVTMVLATDRVVPPQSIKAGVQPDALMEGAKAQGIAIAIMSGGVPLDNPSFTIGWRDGQEIQTPTETGSGGFEIESQSATRIKGRLVNSPYTLGGRDETAWLVNFDAPVLHGDAARMAAEGDALPAGGGQVGADFQAFQQAKLAMNLSALTALGTPALADLLKDPGARTGNLQMLKSMTPPESKVLGGLRHGDAARLYWAQQWPAAANSRCIETLVLKDGKWRSTNSACQAE
jgi:hypothetical protein